jgi:hypothetical protein
MSALAAGWNALTLDLRERDLLNNSELAALTFEQLQLTHSQKEALVAMRHVRKLGLTSVLPARCVWMLLEVWLCVPAHKCVYVRARTKGLKGMQSYPGQPTRCGNFLVLLALNLRTTRL